MTLLMYVQCRNGCILISDRKALDVSGYSREKQKSFLSNRRNFALAGAGNGLEIDFIFSKLSSSGMTGENIKQKLDDLLSEYFSPFSGTTANVFGILVAWENGKSVPYEIKISGAHPSILPLSTQHLCIGIPAARTIADYLMKKINYTELSWEAAVQYAIAVMKEVSENVDGVGRLEEFGFDIIVFLDDGFVCKKINYRKDSANISVKPDIIEDASSEFDRQKIEAEGGGIKWGKKLRE